MGYKKKGSFYQVPKTGWWSLDHFNFHESWDWLMPVVEKIEAETHVHNFHIVRDTAEIIFTSRSMEYPYIEVGGKTKIEGVYRAVMKYIEWYNKK